MAKPQQPELRRSGTVPALDPDAAESDLKAHRRPGDSGKGGPIPEEQQPGHHPEQEQDKPDLDKFAERLGIVAEGEEPEDAPRVEDTEPGNVTPLKPSKPTKKAPASTRPTSTRPAPKERKAPSQPSWTPIGLALVGPVTGILIARDIARRLRRLVR